MGNSPALSVAILMPSVGTDLTRWDINPRSGNLPFTVSYVGYLFRSGINENQADSGIVDGETVQLQILFPGGAWADVGPSVTTGYDSATGYHGYFSGSIPLSSPYVAPGYYQFRARYAGNTTKGLQGCEDGEISVGVDKLTPLVTNNLPLIIGAIIGIPLVGYAVYKMTRK